MEKTRKHKNIGHTKTTANKAFFSSGAIYPKLNVNQPNDKYELEADAMAKKVMTMPEATLQKQAPEDEEEEMLQTKSEKKTPAVSSEALRVKTNSQNLPDVQRQDESETPSPDAEGAPTFSPGAAAIDWFEMSRPFHERGAQHLLFNNPNYYNSVRQLWISNYLFFNRIVGPDLSLRASNFFTPFAIDSALQGDYPTMWEQMDREAGISSFVISPTIFRFDLSNLGRTFQFTPVELFGVELNNPYSRP